MLTKSIRMGLISLSIATFMAGCGSSGSSPISTPLNTPTSMKIKEGILVDMGIDGASYTRGGKSFITASKKENGKEIHGVFGYFVGKSLVVFSIGNLVLGKIKIPADGIVTPQDIVGVDRTDTDNKLVGIMASLLQSLDSDGDPSNGITITPEVTKAFNDVLADGATLESLDETKIEGFVNAINSNLGTTLQLVPVSEALAHLNATLDAIIAGTIAPPVSGEDSGSNTGGTDSSADTNSGSNTASDSDTGAGSDTSSNADTGAGSYIDTGSDAGSGASSGTGGDTNSTADTNATAETNSSTETNTTADTNASREIKKGIFVDMGIDGASYTRGGEIFITAPEGGIHGVFGYFVGESTVIFSIGNLVLGEITVPADGIVTPLDIAGVARTDTGNRLVGIMVSLLQSLDSDGDASNGITITAEVIVVFNSLLGDNVTLASLNEAQISGFVMAINTRLGMSLSFVSISEALVHLNDTLALIASGAIHPPLPEPTPNPEPQPEPVPTGTGTGTGTTGSSTRTF